MSEYSPKGNYLLLEALKESEKVGGIIIPDTARLKLNQGRILEFGPDCDQEVLSLKTGEIIIFPHHAEYRVPSGDRKREFIFVQADQVIAGDNCTTPPVEDEVEEVTLTPKGRRAPIGFKLCCRICGNPIEGNDDIGYHHINQKIDEKHIALK